MSKFLNKLMFGLFCANTLGACAHNAPLNIEKMQNITDVSNAMVKAYSPGTSKLLALTGVPVSSSEYEDFRQSYFKIKAENEGYGLIEKTFKNYCVTRGGEFASENSKLFNSLSVISCVIPNQTPVFVAYVNNTSHNGSATLRCFSVQALENKSLSFQAFADKALEFDKVRLNSNFYSDRNC